MTIVDFPNIEHDYAVMHVFVTHSEYPSPVKYTVKHATKPKPVAWNLYYIVVLLSCSRKVIIQIKNLLNNDLVTGL